MKQIVSIISLSQHCEQYIRWEYFWLCAKTFGLGGEVRCTCEPQALAIVPLHKKNLPPVFLYLTPMDLIGPAALQGDTALILLWCVYSYRAGLLFLAWWWFFLHRNIYRPCCVVANFKEQASYFWTTVNYVKTLEAFRLLFQARSAVKIVIFLLICLYFIQQFLFRTMWSPDRDVVLVRRTIKLGCLEGMGIWNGGEWGGTGEREVSLPATWDQGG
jgi:hypothetical protein